MTMRPFDGGDMQGTNGWFSFSTYCSLYKPSQSVTNITVYNLVDRTKKQISYLCTRDHMGTKAD